MILSQNNKTAIIKITFFFFFLDLEQSSKFMGWGQHGGLRAPETAPLWEPGSDFDDRVQAAGPDTGTQTCYCP